MSTVVYLANQKIQIVNGTIGTKKIQLSSCVALDAPDGSIINGMVMDAESFIAFMKEVWSTYKLPVKDVYLVSNSSKFSGKNVEMPQMNASKTMDYIHREFQDINKGDDQIYGYMNLDNADSKLKRVYAECVPAELIKDYIDIFTEIGVKLKAIYSGESSLIWLVGATLAKKYKTFAIEVAEGMTLSTLLWANGTYMYFNSVRCFHDQGTEEYAADVARSVSQLVQFMQAHQIEQNLEMVSLAGIDANSLWLYQNAIAQLGLQIPVSIYSDENIVSNNCDVQYYLRSASGLYTIGGKSNFLAQYADNKPKNKENSDLKKDFLIVGGVLAVMLIVMGVSMMLKLSTKKKLDELKDYNQSPDVMFNVNLYDNLVARNSFLSGQLSSIDSMDENIYTYPVCNNDILGIIDKCAKGYAEITVQSFDGNEGIITMQAKSETVDDINIFIANLMKEDIFCNVDYTGYTFQEDSQCWNIKVSCTLAESAGRQVLDNENGNK